MNNRHFIPVWPATIALAPPSPGIFDKQIFHS